MPLNLAVLRHGVTFWNQEKRLQGHADIELMDQARIDLSTFTLPEPWQQAVVFSSPLKRCVETAEILLERSPCIDPALIEMSWGDWEGRTLKDLSAELGDELIKNEERGLDLQPPNGESPRAVRERMENWLKRTNGPQSQDMILTVHKGVIRALLSLALDWDMKGDLDFKLKRMAFHHFKYDTEEGLTLLKANIPFVSKSYEKK